MTYPNGESRPDRLYSIVEFCSHRCYVGEAVRDVSERGHLLCGAAGLVVIGVALVALTPTKQSVERVVSRRREIVLRYER